MAEIRALIVDDEPLARRGVRQLLEEHADVVVVGECRDGREAARAMASLAPDLVFLDVQMPGLDGLGLVRLYGPERMPLTVFVTAFDAFAVKAFESHALDYLVKPLSAARFRVTMARVRERLRVRDALAAARALSALLNDEAAVGERSSPRAARRPGTPGERLPVRTPTGERMLDVDAIDWLEVDGDGSRVWSRGTSYRTPESLTALERALDPSRFARIHRATVVRLASVCELRQGDGKREAEVVLDDGTALAVSRRRLAALQAALRGVRRRS